MIVLRTIVSALIMNNKDFLLMKRSENKKFAPGIWATIGGHVEPNEINNPREACLREIFEETEIMEKDLDGLNLRYITIRRSKKEIRVQYIYFCKSNTRNVTGTGEGDLFWVNTKDIFNRRLSTTIESTLRYYLKYGNQKEVMVGVVSTENGMPITNWNPVQDLEIKL